MKRSILGIATFAAIGSFVAWRWCSADLRPEYVTERGISVYDDGGEVPGRAEFSAEVTATLESWIAVPGFAEERISARLRGTRVFVRERPFQAAGNLYEGRSKPRSKRVAVGIDDRGVTSSALAHELGHVISGLDDAALAELRAEYGVR